MNLFAPVSSLMTSSPITVSPSDNMEVVAQLFQEHAIHHLPVVEDKMLVGMISKTDYLTFKKGFVNSKAEKLSDEARHKAFAVSEVMTSGLAKLEVDDRLDVAIEVFKTNYLHALPIVDKDNHLLGIITTHDIIKHLVDDAEVVKSYS